MTSETISSARVRSRSGPWDPKTVHPPQWTTWPSRISLSTSSIVSRTVGSIESTDGTRLHVTTRGHGPPIVLVHGWKGSSRVWDRTVAALEDRFLVVAYDLRGMGASEKPDSRYDFDEHAAALACILEALDLANVTLVGWSMGCSASLQHMARGGSRIGRLVLVNGPVKLGRTDDFPWSMTQVELDAYVAAVERS